MRHILRCSYIKSSHTIILEESIFDFRYIRLYDVATLKEKKMVELFANRLDPDQTPRSAASDLDLHGLPVTCLGVSSLQWANTP